MKEDNLLSFTKTPSEANKRGAIYMSSASTGMHPRTLELQEQTCREYAKKRGWTVVEEFVVADEAKNPTIARGKMLDKLIFANWDGSFTDDSRPFDVLMTDDKSTLCTDVTEVLMASEFLASNGISLCLVNQGLESSEPNFERLLVLMDTIDELKSTSTRNLNAPPIEVA